MSLSKIETSEVDLSGEGLLNVAHCVIQPTQCEWEGCTLTLNSWDTLAKHLSRHCFRVLAQEGKYQCSYSRCSGQMHDSLETLKNHVELSHMSRVAVPCPVRGCCEAFVRPPQLASHFEYAHHEFLDNRVPAQALSSFSTPAPPHALREPPPLPHPTFGPYSLYTTITKAPLTLAYSQATSSQAISRKWSRLNVQDEEGDDHPIMFDNLPSITAKDISAPQIVDVAVRKVQPAPTRSLLSRPQLPIYPPVKSDAREQTILYPAFVRTVDKLVADGVLVRHEEGLT